MEKRIHFNVRILILFIVVNLLLGVFSLVFGVVSDDSKIHNSIDFAAASITNETNRISLINEPNILSNEIKPTSNENIKYKNCFNSGIDKEINKETNNYVIDEKLSKLFFNPVDDRVLPEVYVGGNSLGISLDSKGVKVIGISEIMTSAGITCPAIESGIQIGDIIVKIDKEEIKNAKQINDISASSSGKDLEITFLREGKEKTTILKPKKDINLNQFRLGIWVKEGSSGIGTLSFVTEKGNYASLGHPIIDVDTGEIYRISGGSIYFATITGITKGERGKAGELKGSFVGDKLGDVKLNNNFGVYGQMTDDFYKSNEKYQIAKQDEVMTGKATILSTLSDQTIESYEIEIIKAVKQSSPDDKGLVIRITDERLINQTNGIVQGMSGSPIIQNGKIVGAVTHVFVNDSTKGFGVYAEWMYLMADSFD